MSNECVNECVMQGCESAADASLWDLVADKLLAAMLMLGRNFPLHQALDGHKLAAFIAEQHKDLQQKLKANKDRNVVTVNTDNAPSAEPSSFSADAKLTDDDDAPQHRCGRCTRLKKEVSISLEPFFLIANLCMLVARNSLYRPAGTCMNHATCFVLQYMAAFTICTQDSRFGDVGDHFVW